MPFAFVWKSQADLKVTQSRILFDNYVSHLLLRMGWPNIKCSVTETQINQFQVAKRINHSTPSPIYGHVLTYRF